MRVESTKFSPKIQREILDADQPLVDGNKRNPRSIFEVNTSTAQVKKESSFLGPHKLI